MYDCTKQSVMTYTGKESKKRVDICICITDSLCCTAEINTTLQNNYNKIKLKKKNMDSGARILKFRFNLTT